MKAILVAAIAFASVVAQAEVNYSNQVVLSSSATNVQLADAEYVLIPTRTEVRPIPGCHPHGENSFDCNETVVVESEAAIRANISFKDSTFGSGDGALDKQWISVLFRTTDFSADEVASLQAVYPGWKHPWSKVQAQFAKNKLSLSVEKVKQPLQVVDMKKSKICQINHESGEKLNPNCQDQIVYKDSWTMVFVATVTKK